MSMLWAVVPSWHSTSWAFRERAMWLPCRCSRRFCAAGRGRAGEAGAAGEEATQAAIETMATLNRAAAEVGRKVGVRACTDITGFGLLGHLREMLSGVGARIRLSAGPVLPEE